MRAILILLWLLIPLGAIAYHYGPGVDGQARDHAAEVIAKAEKRLAEDDPAGAVRAYDEAVTSLPASDIATARRLRIERAKARIAASQLAEASQELGSLVEELQADSAADPRLVDDARDALAASDFYVAWLKRLEGLSREEWEPHAESARQTWRLLADEAEADGDTQARDRHAKDLEAVVLLARMEPDELQGLPIPKECKACKSGKCRNCRGGKKTGRNPGQGQGQPKDARGASSGPPPDDSGS
jgi:hypothetical protein